MLVKMPKVVKVETKDHTYRGTIKISMKNGAVHQFNLDTEKVITYPKTLKVVVAPGFPRKLLNFEVIVNNVAKGRNVHSEAEYYLKAPGTDEPCALPLEETRLKSLNAKEIVSVEADIRPSADCTLVMHHLVERGPIPAEQAITELKELGVSDDDLLPLRKYVDRK